MEFNFCPYCGNSLKETTIGTKTQPFCEHCQWVSYRNPTVGVAVILLEKKKLLLVRRIGSYADQWCIPCGHVEWNEDIRTAARREIKEETGLDVTVGLVCEKLKRCLASEDLTLWLNSCPSQGQPIEK